MSYELDVHAHVVLNVLITEYLELLTIIFPNSLEPKHHFLLHYSRVLKLCGPVWKISTMRFGAKHREGKIPSRVAISRVNICKTIAIKHQLRQNFRFLANKTPRKISYEAQSMKSIPLIYLNGYFECMKSLPISIKILKNINILTRVDFEGNIVERGNFLMMPSEDELIFYKIDTIILETPTQFYLLVKKCISVIPHEHTECYHLYDEKYTAILDMYELYSCKITNAVKAFNGMTFIVKRWM